MTSFRRSNSGHFGCLIDLATFSLVVSLSLPLLGACRRHVPDWGWWSLGGAVPVLGGMVLYLWAIIKWFNVGAAWAGWAVIGWLSVLLLANGLLFAHEKGLHGIPAVLPPAVLLGGFWTLCAVARMIFRRMENSHE